MGGDEGFGALCPCTNVGPAVKDALKSVGGSGGSVRMGGTR